MQPKVSLFCFVIIVLLESYGEAGKDYCSISSDHTMCLYRDSKPGPNCCDMNEIHYPLNSNYIDLFLDRHNELRMEVASGKEEDHYLPMAADMLELKWDPELARICQRWIIQCSHHVPPHDICRSVIREGVESQCGQNIYTISSNREKSYKDIIVRSVESWYSELENMTMGDFDGTNRLDINLHYTQMMWAQTRAVGCAIHSWKCNKRYYKRVCCNYEPTGNWEGEPMYTVGKGCSKCPRNTICSNQYKGLCDTRN